MVSISLDTEVSLDDILHEELLASLRSGIAAIALASADPILAAKVKKTSLFKSQNILIVHDENLGQGRDS